MKNNVPLVSICCLTYNHERFIEDTIKGFLIQKINFKIEIIIHDDASTDNTKNIIEKYQKKYPNLFKPIYQTENQYSKGIKPIFKYVFPRARGKYIALCEGDDYWTDPLKLQKQVDFLKKNDRYIVCGTYCDTERFGKLEKYTSTLNHQTFEIYDIISNNRIPTLTMMFRNNQVDYSKLKKYPLGDVGLLLELTKANKLIAKLPINTAVYRYHGQGLNSGKTRYKNTKIQFKTKTIFSKNFNDFKFKFKLKLYFSTIFIKEVKFFIFKKQHFDSKVLTLALKYLFI